jgi:hypothetical protein
MCTLMVAISSKRLVHRSGVYVGGVSSLHKQHRQTRSAEEFAGSI